jgi:hypothetical protein
MLPLLIRLPLSGQLERPQTSDILHAMPPAQQAKCKDQDSLAVNWPQGISESPTLGRVIGQITDEAVLFCVPMQVQATGGHWGGCGS